MAKPVEDPSFYIMPFEVLNSEVLNNLIHNKLFNMENYVCVLEGGTCIIYFLTNILMDMKHILKGQQSVSEITCDLILANYDTHGKSVFSKYLDETVLVTNAYRSSYMLKRLKQYIEQGYYSYGRFLSISEGRTIDVNGHEKIPIGDALQRVVFSSGRSWRKQSTRLAPKRSSDWLFPPKRLELNTSPHIASPPDARYLSQRPSHNTTPELPDDDLYPTLNPNVLCYPVDQIRYHLPVQASDQGPSMDCGKSMVVPSSLTSTGFRYPSNIATNVERFRHRLSASRIDEGNTHELQLPNSHSKSPSEVATPSTRPQSSQTSVRNRYSKQPKHPDYMSYNVRMESFIANNWDETTKPAASTLAESGLYPTGREDLVRCFQCGLGLKDWIKDDDPLTEHVKYSPGCDYLTHKLGSDGFRRFKDALSTNKPNEYQNENSTAGHDRQPYKVRHPRYQTVSQRQQSFGNFPQHLTQSPRELALAGLFFTGESDICRCFTCDGGLKSWAPGDDPFEEHAKYFPLCPYIRQLKGEAYIEMVQRRLHDRGEMVSSSTSPPHFSQRQVTQASSSISTPLQMLEQLSIRPSPPHSIQPQSNGTHDCLQTVAASSVLEMGYSREVVTIAIKQLMSKGKASPDAQDIMELILEYEDSGDIHSRCEQQEQIEDKSRNKNDGMQLMEENEMLKNSMVCVLCNTEERNILCLPCAHHRMCTKCAPSVTHCPSCGKFIKEKIRTFMA